MKKPLKEAILPARLQKGSCIYITAPASSRHIVPKVIQNRAKKKLEEAGFRVIFSQDIPCRRRYGFANIRNKVADLHEGFVNNKVDAIIAAEGGYNSNSLLPYIDWDIIRQNPKIFCGYSDNTILTNAIFAKTGIITYYGPDFSTFGSSVHYDYVLSYFLKCLCSTDRFSIIPSPSWSDIWSLPTWPIHSERIKKIKNTGWKVLREGEAEGLVLGGNLSTFIHLAGTEYFPDIRNAIIFLEDDHESPSHIFDRDLVTLLQQKDFKYVRGIILGRFPKGSKISSRILSDILYSKKELAHFPIIVNVDFGHTDPLFTFPIGGKVRLRATKRKVFIEFFY